jgi:hypothetical protein
MDGVSVLKVQCTVDCSDFDFLTIWSITSRIWMQSEILRHFYNRQAFYKLFRAIFASKFAKSVNMRRKKRWAKFSLGINLMLISNRLKKFEKKFSYKSYRPKMFAHSNQTKNFFVDTYFRMNFLASFQQIQNHHRFLCSLIPLLKSVKNKNNYLGLEALVANFEDKNYRAKQ